jgi:hypothetical protein
MPQHTSWSRDSSVGIATGYGLEDRGFYSRQAQEVVLYPTASRPALGPIQPSVQWEKMAFSRSEADQSPPSSAKVKNGGAIPPFSHTSLWPIAKLIMHRDIFAFYIYSVCLKTT